MKLLQCESTQENLAMLFDPDSFLEDCAERGTIDLMKYEDYLDGNIPYGQMVYSLCHNGVAWCALRLKQYLSYGMDIDMGMFYWNNGTYYGSDHSWMEMHVDGDVYVIDITIAQSNDQMPKLYFGPKTEDYCDGEICCLNDNEKLMYFAEVHCGF